MFVPDRKAKALEEWNQNLAHLEQALGYAFRQPERLQEAMTHRSFVHEAHDESIKTYERLEFLGDAVLELVISHLLWERYPSLSEGDLTRLRAEIVKKKTLAVVARRLSLGELLLLGKGEQQRGGTERSSILADALEAILGAVFVDGGISAARLVCLRLLQPELQKLDLASLPNFKNQLQEWAAKKGLAPPHYKLIETEGPEHRPTFVMEVAIEQQFRAVGRGSNKKSASQEAARQLLETLPSSSSSLEIQPRDS